ncbi:MAG: hypothetical protein H7338_11820 [Candidatus Sericytochromatia bacterium]|nr:hypothetical protein [Candidatus Sericytochromatia bacterium]
MLRRPLAGLLLIVCLLPAALATSAAVVEAPQPSLLRQVGPGTVDWRSRRVIVIGTGQIDTVHPEAQARLLGRRAAVADAYRQLAETVNGVQVTVSYTARAITTKNRVVETRVQGLIKGAKPGEPTYTPDGRVTVPMCMPLFGTAGLAWGLELGQLVKTLSRSPMPTAALDAVGPMGSWMAALLPSFVLVAAAATGIIIDAGGLGVEPAMAPFVLGVGQRVYVSGKVAVDPDRVLQEGITTYAGDLAEAKANTARLGNNPMIFTARGVVGRPSTDILVSSEDAIRIEQLNQQFHLLDQLKVTVVI